VLALPNLDSQEMRQDLGREEMLSPILSEASGGQHQPALMIHSGSRQRKFSRLNPQPKAASGVGMQSAPSSLTTVPKYIAFRHQLQQTLYWR